MVKIAGPPSRSVRTRLRSAVLQRRTLPSVPPETRSEASGLKSSSQTWFVCSAGNFVGGTEPSKVREPEGTSVRRPGDLIALWAERNRLDGRFHLEGLVDQLAGLGAPELHAVLASIVADRARAVWEKATLMTQSSCFTPQTSWSWPALIHAIEIGHPILSAGDKFGSVTAVSAYERFSAVVIRIGEDRLDRRGVPKARGTALIDAQQERLCIGEGDVVHTFIAAVDRAAILQRARIPKTDRAIPGGDSKDRSVRRILDLPTLFRSRGDARPQTLAAIRGQRPHINRAV